MAVVTQSILFGQFEKIYLVQLFILFIILYIFYISIYIESHEWIFENVQNQEKFCEEA
jgi:cell division protein FtsL